MMRTIVTSSLRLRVAVAAVAAGILALGLVQLPNAPVDIYPEFAPPYIEVQTEALGLSSAEVEQLITVPLEADLLNGVAWVEDIRSESVPGLSSITLVFEPGTDLLEARQAVQERLAQAHALPNVSAPPQMLQPVSSASRTMMIGLSSSKLSLIEISQLARWTIKPRLMGVEGVANVSTYGQRERQLQVQVDPQRLRNSRVDLLQVVRTAGNALWVSPLSFLEASTPGTGGFIESANQRLGVRHVSPIVSANDLAQVAVVDRAPLRLGEVADVVEGHQPLIGDALVDNGPGLILVVEKLRDANTVDVSAGIEEALTSLRPALTDLTIDTSIYRPADYIQAATANVGRGFLVGLLLVAALLAFAFYSWRRALVCLLTLAVALVAAGVALQMRGASFNAMTLAGLAVALVAVFDDAIAGTERVARRLRERGERGAAATVVDASLEVRGPLTYAALFTLLPVVPVFFMGDLFGAFGRPLAISYASAVGVSMLCALVLTPALSLLLTSSRSGAERPPRWVDGLGRRYHTLLGRLVAPRPALLLAGLLGLVGLAALPGLRSSDLPALRERDYLIELEAAAGTSLQRMTEITSAVAAELKATPGIRNVASHTGRAVTGDKVVGVNSSELWVSIDAGADYAATVAALKRVVDAHPELDRDILSYQQAQLKQAGTGADGPVVVRVYGNERGLLAEKAAELGQALGKIDGIEDLQVELPAEEPTLEVTVDLQRAQRFGVKPGDVRRAAAILLSGINVGQLFYDQKVFDVVVWGTPQIRENAEQVKNLLLDTPGGTQVRLEEVADVRIVNAPDVIEREGVFRRIDINATVAGRSRDAVAADIRRAIASTTFPLEYRAELLGDYSERQAVQRRLIGLGAFAALAMLLLLQACFGSWRLGAATFVALLLAPVGGVLAAVLGGGAITIGAAAGLLAVLGVAARSGILLIRRYQQLERSEGEPLGTALVLRGAGERLVPTLMTTLAVGLAFAPFVVRPPAPGFEILRPMGMVVLGGLATTLLVTLVILPALYLRFATVHSDTEVDIRHFEEELLAGAGIGS